jgi:hypothetical protein
LRDVATFLVTPKMNPELAARVEASVRGRRGDDARAAPTRVAVMRVLALAAALCVLGLWLREWQHRDAELEAARDELLVAIGREASSLTPRDHQLSSRVDAMLKETAADSDDVVSEQLAKPEALAAWLAKPTAYFRAERAAFAADVPLLEKSRSSLKDAFILCLIHPPKTPGEKAMLKHIQRAYAGALEKRTPNVRRLHAAVHVLALLSREWLKRVEEADSLAELNELQKAFERAPIERGKAAARSELLIYLLDEPTEQGAPTELDGASRHDVQVGFIDVRSGKPLLRLRQRVDPAWISDANRPEMGRALNSCNLAIDVRARLTGEQGSGERQ